MLVCSNIQLIYAIFIVYILRLKCYCRHVAYIKERSGERDRERDPIHEKPKINIIKLYSMLDGEKCYGEKSIKTR